MKYINEYIDSSDPNLPDTVYQMLEKISNMPPSQQQNNRLNAYGPTCHSKAPVQFAVPQCLQVLLNLGLYSSTLLNVRGDHGMVPSLTDHNSKCQICGSPWSSQNSIEMQWTNKTTTVFTMKSLFQCKGDIITFLLYFLIQWIAWGGVSSRSFLNYEL